MASSAAAKSVGMANGSSSDGHTPSNFTLHVRNLPLDLEKDGVSSIFREYGEVAGVILAKDRNNTKQGYISYLKYNEAELAINELHEKLPLMLSVQFKDKSLRTEQKASEINLSSPIVDFRYSSSIMDHLPNTKKAIDLGRSNCSPAFRANVYTSEDDLLYPVPTDLTTFNPYDTPGPYHDTNLMYTRGLANITRDGRRHISYGRGYTYYNLPEPHYNIATYLQNVIERREKGIYEYAPDDAEDDTGNCKVCQTPTAFRCQKCSVTFYCSKPCQVDDWAKHKLECQPVPPLIKKKLANKAFISNGHSTEGTPKEPAPEVPKQTQLRRPKMQPQEQQHQTSQHVPVKTPVQEQQKPINHTPPHNIRHNKESSQSPVSARYEKPNSIGQQSPTRSTKSSTSQNYRSSDENRNNLNKQSTGNFSAVSTSFPVKQNSSQTQNQNTDSLKTSEDNIVFQSHTYLPKTEFVDVIITTSLGNGGYLVQKVSDTEAIEGLCFELNEYVKSVEPIEPEENIKCIIYSETSDMYFRATIFSIKDNIAKVFHHDFGTYEDIPLSPTSVRPIGRFKDLPHFARHVRIIDEADPSLQNVDEMNILSVKAVRVTEEGVIIVEAKPLDNINEGRSEARIAEQLANCTLEDSAPLRPSAQEITDDEFALKALLNVPSVLETLKVDQCGMVILLGELGRGEFNVTATPNTMLDDFTKLLGDLAAECEDLTKTSNFTPKVGDLICGKSEHDEWFRGIVMSTKPIVKLAVIDESRIMTPIKCSPMPEKYRNIPSMGFICKFLPNTPLPTNKLDSGAFLVSEISDNSVMVKITCDSENPVFVGSATLKKWIPKSEQKGIEEVQLISGQEIQVMDVFSHNILYVRSKEATEVERTHLLEQEVAKYALNRKPLTEMPVVGQMVLSHYQIDGNFYRAIVTKVEGQKILVKYIDYGNDEETELKNLSELPKELKECPASTLKVKLKDIDDNIPLTQEATDYITEIIATQENLSCIFTGHPFKDGVLLKRANNENVNVTLKNLLKRSWEKENKEEDKKVYQIEDLPIFKLGDVGDEVEAIVLFHYSTDVAVVLGPNDMVAAEATQGQLSEAITKYVETTTEHYIPRDKELCIAMYMDCYYRALCLDSSATPTESRVFFIDFGNTELVKHTDIRVFTEDFTKLAPFGILCSIEIPRNKQNQKLAERITELAPVNEIITLKIISVSEDTTPNIDIPSVRVKLIEEGLL